MKGKKYRYDKQTGKMVEVKPTNVIPMPPIPQIDDEWCWLLKCLMEMCASQRAFIERAQINLPRPT